MRTLLGCRFPGDGSVRHCAVPYVLQKLLEPPSDMLGGHLAVDVFEEVQAVGKFLRLQDGLRRCPWRGDDVVTHRSPSSGASGTGPGDLGRREEMSRSFRCASGAISGCCCSRSLPFLSCWRIFSSRLSSSSEVSA